MADQQQQSLVQNKIAKPSHPNERPIPGSKSDGSEGYFLGIDPGTKNIGWALLRMPTEPSEHEDGEVVDCGVFGIWDGLDESAEEIKKRKENTAIEGLYQASKTDTDFGHQAVISLLKRRIYSNELAHLFCNPSQVLYVGIEEQAISNADVKAVANSLCFHFAPRSIMFNAMMAKTLFKVSAAQLRKRAETADAEKTAVIKEARKYMTEDCRDRFDRLKTQLQQHPADATLYAVLAWQEFYKSHHNGAYSVNALNEIRNEINQQRHRDKKN